MLSDRLVAPPGSGEATPHPLHQTGPVQPEESTDHVTQPPGLWPCLAESPVSGHQAERLLLITPPGLASCINEQAGGQDSASRPQASGCRFLQGSGEASVCLLLWAWVTRTPFHFVVAMKAEMKPGLCRFLPTAEGLADVRGRPASQRRRTWVEGPVPTTTAIAVCPVSPSPLSHTQGDYLGHPYFSLFAALGNADRRRWVPPLPHDQRGRGHTGSHHPHSPGVSGGGCTGGRGK